MRSHASATVVGLGAVVLVLGGAGVAFTATPAVPSSVQARILAARPALAVTPTRLPLHYRFTGARFDAATSTQILRFGDARFPGNRNRRIEVATSGFPGDCASGRTKTLQLAGNRVYLGPTPNIAWRCLTPSDKGQVKVTATSGFLPDVALGALLASVRKISQR